MNPNNFTLELSRIRRHIRAEFEAQAAALDITVPQFQVLRRLWQSDGMLASEIAKDICAANSTLTGVIDRLESKGLLERRPSSEDRRATEIWLTKAGYLLEKPLMDIVQAIDAKALAGFSVSEHQQFMQFLKKIGDNLEL